MAIHEKTTTVKEWSGSHCALTTATGSNESNVGARFHRYTKATEHTNARARWIAKVNIFEPDMALDILWNVSFCRFGIDFGSRIKQLNNVRRGTACRRNIGHESEYIAGLHSTEEGRLFRSRKGKRAVV